jgi:hypothetical protein
VQLAIRYQAWNADAGLPRDWPIPETERARIRTELSRELFTQTYGRAPLDDRELSGFVAKASAQPTTATAGYDLTFTPVKSVSTLWAVAPTDVAAAIEACHDQVVAETVQWLETTPPTPAAGRNGVRQVDVHGLLAAAFTTATAGPETRTCTPTWRSATRCRRSTAAGSPWTAGRSTNGRRSLRALQHPPGGAAVDRLGVAFTERRARMSASGRSGRSSVSTPT